MGIVKDKNLEIRIKTEIHNDIAGHGRHAISLLTHWLDEKYGIEMASINMAEYKRPACRVGHECIRDFVARKRAPSVYSEVRQPVIVVNRISENPIRRSVRRWSPTGTAPPIHSAHASGFAAMLAGISLSRTISA